MFPIRSQSGTIILFMQNSILVYSQAKVERGIPDAVQSDRLAFMLEMAEV